MCPKVEKRVYRPKLKCKENFQEVLLPKVSEAPDDIPPQWPTWLEDLLSVVHYNFEMGLVFYCVSCSKGLYQAKNFEEGAHHCGHRRLLIYDYKGSICVSWADIECLGVNTQEIQKFGWSLPGIGSSLFVFVHNTFGYGYQDLSKAATPWKNCTHCRTRLQYVPGWTKTRFCGLECKFQVMVGKQGLLSPKLVSAPPIAPLSDSRLAAQITYTQVTTQGIDYKKSLKRMRIMDGQKHFAYNGHSVQFPRDTSCSLDKLRAIIHEHPVQQVPDLQEVERICLPEALYDELDVLLSPCEEMLSMYVTTARRSPTSSPEDISTEGHSSCSDCKPVKKLCAQNLCISTPSECMVPTTLLESALAAASYSSNVGERERHKTTANRKRDWDVEGERMEVDGLEVTPKFLTDNLLRNAGFLLRSLGSSEFENIQPDPMSEVVDINSTEWSPSAGGIRGIGPELSISSPEVESFKVEGPIDFTSLQQLLLTFDPLSWMSNARARVGPVVVPELPPNRTEEMEFNPTLSIPSASPFIFPTLLSAG